MEDLLVKCESNCRASSNLICLSAAAGSATRIARKVGRRDVLDWGVIVGVLADILILSGGGASNNEGRETVVGQNRRDTSADSHYRREDFHFEES
jgi:hypothetical protein